MNAAHNYCVDCARKFTSSSNLAAHLRSHIHTPKTFECPNTRCAKAFVSQSALYLHWEANYCPSGITRDEICWAALELDRCNIVTRIFGGQGRQSSPQIDTARAVGSSRNLSQRLQSPRHEDKIFWCPTPYGCGKEFLTLSAICQHIESRSCKVLQSQEVRIIMIQWSVKLERLIP